MKVLTFDVETTGLLPKNILIRDTHKFPYIIQLSWIVFDFSLNKLESVNDYIIKLPLNISISKENTNIHGITMKQMKSEGKDIKKILAKFKNDIRKVTLIVGHNIKFDKTMVEVELYRNGFKNCFECIRKKEFCTMKKGENLCGLKMLSFYTGKEILKYPKLTELHIKLFQKNPSNVHNSLIDILMCFRCYYKMEYECDVMETNPRFARLFSSVCVF